jgi:hypothetical protein
MRFIVVQVIERTDPNVVNLTLRSKELGGVVKPFEVRCVWFVSVKNSSPQCPWVSIRDTAAQSLVKVEMARDGNSRLQEVDLVVRRIHGTDAEDVHLVLVIGHTALETIIKTLAIIDAYLSHVFIVTETYFTAGTELGQKKIWWVWSFVISVTAPRWQFDTVRAF